MSVSAKVQAGIAIVAALGLHFGLFALRPPEQAGSASSGAGGMDLVSLEAADAVMGALVEEWETAPDQEIIEAEVIETPDVPEPPPEVPVIADPLLLAEPLPELELPKMAELAPVADISLPEPPPEAPEPEAEPKPGPKPEVKPEPRPEKKPEPKPEKKTEPKPEKKSAPRGSAGQAAQVAAGSGGGTSAGDGGRAAEGTSAKGKIDDLRAGWGAQIRARIERRKGQANVGGAKGTVTVRLVVTNAGALVSVALVKSSGNDTLDQAALQTVKRAGKFPGAPKGLNDAQYTFSVPIRFSR